MLLLEPPSFRFLLAEMNANGALLALDGINGKIGFLGTFHSSAESYCLSLAE